MANWDIKVLYYGKINVPVNVAAPGLVDSETLDVPYLGFLLQSGDRNVLVDCGMSEKYIVNGRAWGGYPAESGHSFVEEALRQNGVTPDQIDMVIYTHLHNDHAGTCDLFPRATHVFQKDEWGNLLDPIPAQRFRGDFDLSIIPVLSKFKTIKVDGDVEVVPGVKLYKALGHTLGSQLVTVETARGNMVILGDLCNTYCMLFPETDELIDLYGEKHKIKTNVEYYGPAIPSTVIYDYFGWYDSAYKAKALAQGKWEFTLPGHEPALVTQLRKK